MYDGEILIQAKLDTKQFDAQIDQVVQEIEELQYLLNDKDTRLSGDDAQKYAVQLEKAKNKLKSLIEAKEKANRTPIEDNKNLENIGAGMNKIISKVKRWALAVFGVRSAYAGIRQATSIIAQYDKQMGANIEYIKYALAMTLKPLIEWLINGVYTLLQYVNYIAKAWFNIDLFANASANSFKKANASAKQLQRTMSGFDEMNTLGSTKGVGSSFEAPSFDFAKNVKIPDWVDWIAKNKDKVLEVLKEIAIVFASAKVLSLLGNLTKLGKVLGTGGILGSLSSIAILGGLAVLGAVGAGIYNDLKEINKELDTIYDKSNKKVKENITNQKSVTTLLDQENTRLQSQNDLVEESNTWFAKITGQSERKLELARKSVSYQQDTINKLKKEGELNGYSVEDNFKICEYLSNALETNKNIARELEPESEEYKNIKNQNQQINDYLKDRLTDLLNEGYSYDQIATKLGVNKQKIEEIANGNYVASIKVQNDSNSFTKAYNSVVDWLNKLSNKLQLKLGIDVSSSSSRGGGTGSGGHFAKGGIVPTYYASGGVVSMPGTGVPVGYNSYAGERGVEGVIPLTDSQQMSLLGEAIGRYVSINLTNNTNLDGRVIARQITKVQNSSDFARNR